MAMTVSIRGAVAHEPRTVADKYLFEVGFITEPVQIGEPNGVDLTVAYVDNNEPVEGLEKTLKVDVTVAGETTTLELVARPNVRGAYTADFVPTKAGTYVFRFYGTIEGTPIDEEFQQSQVLPNTTPTNAGLQTRSIVIAVGIAVALVIGAGSYALVSRRNVRATGSHEEPI